MIENIKIAIKRQKKLIAIFLLTIFVPSVLLSVFGIRAIRNERFRLERQKEMEYRRIAEIVKTQINSRFNHIEIILTNTAQYPSFIEKDYEAIEEILKQQIIRNALTELIFILYRDEEPLFPQIRPLIKQSSTPSGPFQDNAQQPQFMRAQEYEFQKKDYLAAISVYEQMLSSTDRIHQAYLLNHLARNLRKAGRYRQAIQHYVRIVDDYPESQTASRLPLGLMAELQIVECYRALGENLHALTRTLQSFENLLHNRWNLNEDQFTLYTSMVKEKIASLLGAKENSGFEKEDHDAYERLSREHEKKLVQWRIHNRIKDEIIPDLRKRHLQTDAGMPAHFHISKTIEQRDYLVFVAMIPGRTDREPIGMLGITMNNDYLAAHVLEEIVDEFPPETEVRIAISAISGNRVYGDMSSTSEHPVVTEFFDNHFPPWKIEIYDVSGDSPAFLGIRKSFYFWTILTLITVLIFGVVLIMMTIAREREILKIKSDFVSSVSHELKTPLTSIKALTERLLEGKVKSRAKMTEYFSVISQDTEKLTRLVKNVLDFSKIEEGKKEYDFEETDIAAWAKGTVDDFLNDHIQEELKVRLSIVSKIPPLRIDEDALSRSLTNLLDNAVKFSPEEKEVEVRLIGEDDRIILQVKDKGIGIPKDELGKIFDKFYQGSHALRQSVKGTGLGLTLVKHAVDGHGGTINVESELGKGTTFTLIFPRTGTGK